VRLVTGEKGSPQRSILCNREDSTADCWYHAPEGKQDVVAATACLKLRVEPAKAGDSFLGAPAAADPQRQRPRWPRLCAGGWRCVRLHDGYWGAISAIIVLQSNMGATVTASRDRILGTLIGACFGFSFSLFGVSVELHPGRAGGGDCLRPCWDCAAVRGWPAVTITIIMLVQKPGRAGAWRWTA
jgi:hypothetical protein